MGVVRRSEGATVTDRCAWHKAMLKEQSFPRCQKDIKIKNLTVQRVREAAATIGGSGSTRQWQRAPSAQLTKREREKERKRESNQ